MPNQTLLDALKQVGALMANCMFNMAQRTGHPLTSGDAENFDRLRKAWDAAIAAAPQAAPMPDEWEAFDKWFMDGTYGNRPYDVYAEHGMHEDLAIELWNKARAALSAAPVSEQPQEASTAPDPVVEANRELLLQRSIIGIKKYGVTLEQSGLSQQDFLRHALEESLDLANYLQGAIRTTDVPASTAQPDSDETGALCLIVEMLSRLVAFSKACNPINRCAIEIMCNEFGARYNTLRAVLTTAQPADHINDAVEMVQPAKPSANDIARAFNTWAPTPAQPQQLSDEEIARLWDAQRKYHGGETFRLGHMEFARALLAAQGGGK